MVLIINIIIIIIIITVFWGRTCYLNTDLIYVKSFGHNLNISHRRHICNFFYL
jgi:hypothetical protein